MTFRLGSRLPGNPEVFPIHLNRMPTCARTLERPLQKPKLAEEEGCDPSVPLCGTHAFEAKW